MLNCCDNKHDYCVYVHINKLNRFYYFGITNNIKRRWQNSGYAYKSSRHFYSAIQKYGWNSFDHVVLFDCLTKEKACEIEIRLIEKYKERVYNIAKGGDCGPALYGSDNPNYHKIRSEEHCKRLAESLKGHYVSNETKQKISENNMMKRKVKCLETNMVFDSITIAAEYFDTFIQNIWRVASKKRKSWHGYHFEYVDTT